MSPKVLFSFPECTVRKHQLLMATWFPDELPSSELQLPSPRLATSSLNIEHNERAFFKQPFYTAPLKGTTGTNSKERMQAAPPLIEKRVLKLSCSQQFFLHTFTRQILALGLIYPRKYLVLIWFQIGPVCQSDAWKTLLQWAYLITDCFRETNEAQMDNLICSWHSIPCIAQSPHPGMTQARYKTTPTTTPSTSPALLPKSTPILNFICN